MTDINIEEPLSNLSDSSFVILGQGSLPSNVNCEVRADSPKLDVSNVSFDMSMSASNRLSQSRCSNASSIFEGNIQEKINQLVQENFELKETLSQNNLAIKSQLDTFIMWQQEVLKTHESHKEKFMETKELILKLKAENASLKKKLEESLPNLSSLNDGDNQFMTSGGEDLIKKSNSNQIKVEGLNQDLKKIEDKCQELTLTNENLTMEKFGLQEKLKDAESRILKLNKELEEVMRENIFLKQKNSESQQFSPENFSYGSLPNSEARAQISNLFKQLEDERAKVSKLKQELEKEKLNDPTQVDSKPATEKLIDYIQQLDDMNISLDRQNERINGISSWVSLAEENFHTLKGDKVDAGVDCTIMSEIAQLKSQLHQEENSSKQKQENLQEIHSQFHKLLQDYKDLQKKLNSLESNNLSLQKYKDDIRNLAEELKVKNEELVSKQQECDKLTEDIKKLNLECEEVAILRVQVQLYQTDFNDEREAREKLVGEKEEMAEQIRLLQSRLDEKGNKSSPESTSSPEKGKKSRYVCPKCMFSFSDLKKCEEHIDDCLNIHFYP